jgi:1-pyrroline-5-carboxylate dehydrogenase
MADPFKTQKITYATMSTDRMEDLHRAFDAEIARVPSTFGQTHPMFINGAPVQGEGTFDDTSPIDTSILIGRFQKGTRDHVRTAVEAARAAFPGWSALPWERRVDIVRRVATLIREHRWELSVLMGYEAGKNRLECLGDVEESADLIIYYCDQIEEHRGFELQMQRLSPGEDNRSVLRPYGVWAVISPFNFPLALAAGPAGAALAAGNTVVFKPASDTPLLGRRLYDLVAEAGVPRGAFNFVTGPGSTVGQELVDNPGVDGIVFTGSTEVGMKMLRDSAQRHRPRPVITEMGGKNPAIVMRSADLEKATDGVMRSAFGAQGQKCSACSRVYVARELCDRFTDLLVAKTRRIRVGNPLERDVWLGPVINETALRRYEGAIARASRDGGRILTGGRRLLEEPFNRGYFVEPTVIDGLATDHPLFGEELFVPITLVADVTSLDQAVALANATDYGLTAGIFSEDDREVDRFFNLVEAGVLYANRRAGATTGAWPGVNPFGGWKASGSSGRGTGGPHYVQQFMREQSRVRIR